MCVDTKNLAWERPAVPADAAILATHFPGIDFADLLNAMSRDGAKPLTTDLVLVGAMIHTAPDERGMRYVPFCGARNNAAETVKLPVMDQIAEWFENTALGTDMWLNASDWCQEKIGARVHFAMNCGCGLVDVTGYVTGTWARWKENFNQSRAHLFGRTRVVRRDTDDRAGTDLTPAQIDLWRRIRACLEALPAA